MRVHTPPLRRALAAASLPAAIVALGAAASSASAASAVVHYTCNVPLIGNQPLYVNINAPNFPTSATVGQPTAPFGITANSVTGGNTYLAITLTQTAKLTDASPGFAGNTKAVVTQADGTTQNVTVPVSIGSYNVPSQAPLRLTATGTSPAVTPTVAGPAKVTVADLNLNLRAFRADNTPVALGSTSDSDGDVNSFDMACKVASGSDPWSGPDGEAVTSSPTQDTTLGTINVAAPVDNPPSKPGTPSASNITSTTANLSWAASTDDHSVAGYEVYNGSTRIATSTTNSVALTGLTPGTSYTLTVKAKDDKGQLSEASNPVTFTTQQAVDNPPSKPGTPTVSGITTTSANVSWAASTDDKGVAGYEVYNGSTRIATSTTNSVALTGLTPATSYTLTVKAKDTAGQLSAASDAVTFKTLTPPDTTAPTAPTGLAGTPSSNSVALSWTASTDNVGVTGYDVYKDGTKVQTVTGTTATITGLTPETSYKFKVAAKDAAGNVSAFSTEITVKTSAAPPSGNGVTVKYSLKGSTFIKGGNGSAPLNGSITATLDLTTGKLEADLAVDPTKAKLNILGFLPVDATIILQPIGKTTGTLVNGVMSATTKANINLPSAKLLGVVPIAGGKDCRTATPVTIPLKSTGAFFNPVEGGDVAGTYTLPKLTDCGLLTSVLSALTAVPGNTINAKLTPQI